MSSAHLHLILNHIPVIGIPFGIALLVFGLWRKSTEIKTAGLVVFVTTALVTIPIFLTGEAAEEIVEHLPGTSERLIENHERAATIALVATSVLGGLSLLRLLVPARHPAIGGPVMVLVFVLSFGVAGWLARTANLGGQIRHPEIRQSQTTSVPEEEGERVESLRDAEDEDKDGRSHRRRGRGRGGRADRT